MTIEAQIKAAVESAIAPFISEVRALRMRLDPPNDWLTTEEAAKRLGVSESTIRRKVALGELQTNGRTGKAKRVRI